MDQSDKELSEVLEVYRHELARTKSDGPHIKNEL